MTKNVNRISFIDWIASSFLLAMTVSLERNPVVIASASEAIQSIKFEL